MEILRNKSFWRKKLCVSCISLVCCQFLVQNTCVQGGKKAQQFWVEDVMVAHQKE